MLAPERRDLILQRLHADGRVVARDLAIEWNLSEDSIRRDLRDLAAAGLCQRVYGGALPVSPAVADYVTRTAIAAEGKHKVAARAVELLAPSATVFFDGGTTTLEVARMLPRDRPMTVITHSPAVALALLDAPAVDVQIIGGRLFRHSAVASGAAAADAVQRIRADVFLLGVTGVHPDQGLTTGDADDAAMKRMIAARAADTYVLASHEKVGTASPFTVLGIDEVAGIITDAPSEHPALQAIAERGTPVLTA
ncbi:DeoR/GlpR family DNA-binding transcription regulator [Microbacterium sp. NPDC055903]